MRLLSVPAVAFAAVAACWPADARAEKLLFHDELTGVEIWRVTDYSAFHEYCHASHPFSYDGRRIATRWRSGKGIVVVDTADGSETVFGREHKGTKMRPCFVRRTGRHAVVYSTHRADGGEIFLYDLDTRQERRVMTMAPGVSTPCAGVIGPNSEYVLLRGDQNGDGLGDWGLKSLWTDAPARVVWTSPTTCAYPNTASPAAACNRLDLSTQICHPSILRRVRDGEKLNEYTLWPDSSFEAYAAVLDVKTGTIKTYPARHARRWAHEAWSGDGEVLHMGGYSWRAGADAPSVPVRIGDAYCSNHYGTCGASGRYVAGDSGRDGMERLELTDLWTGEMRTVAYISTPTEPAGRIGQDHGHPAGSPDGTKVLVHSCYDLPGHRLYAVPTADVRPGDAVIPVRTTEGFAPRGKLLVGHGYSGKRMTVSYERADATHFHGCKWGPSPTDALKRAIKRDTIPAGSLHITDYHGRLLPDGSPRERKEYVVVVKRPDPPRALAAALAGDGEHVRLTWRPPASCRELAGYAVYRRDAGGPLQRLTPELLTRCEYVDTAPATTGQREYVVRAIEHSGLYGDYSGAAIVAGRACAVRLLDSYDVRGCTYVTPGQRPTSDRRRVRVDIPADGRYVLWGRCRAWRDTETLRVSIGGKEQADATVRGVAWHWVRLAERRLGAGEQVVELSREESYEISDANRVRNPGFEDGLTGWTVDKDVASLDATRARSGQQCLKLSGLLTRKKLFQAMDLTIKPEWSYRLPFWIRGRFSESEAKRYHGPHPNTLGRIAVNLEPMPYPRTWTLDGNRFDDVQWRRIETVCNSPPLAPGRRPVTKVRAQPFWCPWYWGRQVGTVWIDDVSVTELGPRLRPAKVTRLLVTNVAGYTPTGPDGRQAYPFPHTPRVAVAELRQTGRSRESVTLAWRTKRASVRACNVYVNAGPDCPTTKYFLHASVWGKTTATIGGLAPAAAYTVRVTALNDDGLEGPAATLHATTAAGEPETHVLEAEQGAVRAPMVVRKDKDVAFVVTPAAPGREDELCDRSNAGRQTGTVRFAFTIRQGGVYAVRGRALAPSGASNSFWFSLDGRPERLWELPTTGAGQWSWTSPLDTGTCELKPGEHTIAVRTREAGARLDRLVVTNDRRANARAGR